MPTQLFTNNASAVLTVGINTSMTTLQLDNAAGFPSPTGGDFFTLALIGLNINGQEASWEIMQCTAKVGNALTVVRAQESTTAASWGVGTKVELRMTADFASTTAAHIGNTSNPHGVTKVQVGLGSVDNTSDADKPVSTAQTTALGLKQATLVSGTSIKTINSTSLLGSGNIATGDVTLAGVQSLTNKTITDTVFAVTGTTPALTATNGAVQTWTLSAASTPTNALTSGQSIILVITPGANTITWPSVTWTKQGGSGAAPTLFSAGKTSIVLWMVGAVLYGSHLGDTV